MNRDSLLARWLYKQTVFDRSVPLPPELKITHIREAIEHVEGRAEDLIDIYFEQANVFSGIVGILGIQALHL